MSLTYQAEVKADASIIVAGAEAKTGYDLSTGLTATLGNTVTATTPHNMTTVAKYGVYTVPTKGTWHYVSGCHEFTTPLSAQSPLRVGWLVWNERA